MTLQELKKQVKICDLIGVKEQKREFFILAPWRDERTASVKINVQKNTFYDFGIGKGGSVIDFVCMLKGCSVAEAVRFLREYAQGERRIVLKVKETRTVAGNNKKIEVKSIKELAHPALLGYVRSRRIDLSVAKKYTKEIYYVHTNKTYFAVAFKNDSGGYELRNVYFKGTIGNKDISFINNNADKIAIFEGFFDFLTFATMLKARNKEERYDFLVLNSVALADKAIHALKQNNYKQIYLFFDADEAGNTATSKFVNSFGNVVKDMRKFYKSKKDLSEFWQAVV